MTSWRRLLCVLTGGHRWLHPRAPEPGELIQPPASVSRCTRCGHLAVWDLADLRPPVQTYSGVPERHAIRTERRLRVIRSAR